MRADLRFCAESGMTLIEVVVGAALLALIAGATLTAFIASDHLTADAQRHSQADALAQQDEDRLRGLTVGQLSGLNQTRTVSLNGTTFTITSTATWETESTGTSSCSGSGSADVLDTKSQVTWPTMGSRSPVVAEGVITPPIGGSLIVQVTDSQGNGVSAMSVTGTGPQALSATTGSGGCAIFGALAGGNYNVSVGQVGYVDKDGNTSPPVSQQSTTVIPGSSVTKTFMFDRAGQISTTFTTKPYGATGVTGSTADTVAVFNNNMTLPGFRWAGTSNTFASNVTLTNVFPFSSNYTVYAGSCSANAPSSYGGTDPTASVAPGGTTNVVEQLPPINLTVYTGTTGSPGALANKPHVILTDQNCGGSPPTNGGTPLIERTPTTTTAGRLADPGQPYGKFKVCADYGNKWAASTITNSNLSGTPVTFYLGSTGQFGTCT